MDYNRNGLKVHKSWFMFDDKIVCLGAGINSSEGLPVTTSVNQSFLNGEVIIKNSGGEKQAGETEEIVNPVWIMHDDMGYIFPAGGKLKLETKNIEGSWNWVASRYPEKISKAGIFKFWFEHGTNPKNESYEYLLVPNATKAGLEEMENQAPFILQNEKNKQEVIASDGSIAGVVFYDAGKSDVFGGIDVDQPCLVMLKNQENGLQVSVADPTQLITEINLILNGQYSGENCTNEKGKTVLKVVLPQGGQAGKTVTLKLKKL